LREGYLGPKVEKNPYTNTKGRGKIWVKAEELVMKYQSHLRQKIDFCMAPVALIAEEKE
jgi:hypothetical protein